MALDCNLNPNSPLCKSYRKSNKTKTTFCTSSQYNCNASKKTFYTNCLGFNQGCKVYDLVGSNYVPAADGFYSNGTVSYFINDGTVLALGESCPRFFLLDWIKDCIAGDNLSGTWYVSVIDDDTWVPDTNVVYHIPIPVSQVGDCSVSLFSYWSVRFANTTPTYNIGDNDYLEAKVADMNPTYKLPGFLQNRCKTRQNI